MPSNSPQDERRKVECAELAVYADQCNRRMEDARAERDALNLAFDKLIAENKRLDELVGMYDKENILMTRELTALRASRDALALDAERLNWLDSEHLRFDPVAALTVKYRLERHSSEWVNVMFPVRAAIDAARSAVPATETEDHD